MVNIPKKKNTYCKRCDAHTEQKISQQKKGKVCEIRQGQRRYDRKQRGCNGQTRPILRRKCKITKKLVLKLECIACKAIHQTALKRTKYVEFGAKKKIKGAALNF